MVPVGKVILRSENDEWRNRPTLGTYALDHYCPFAIARLSEFGLATAVRGRNHHPREDDAHHEPSLVEIVGILIEDPILGLGVLYKRKPLANDLRIFVLRPLVVISMCKARTEL